MKQVIMGTAGHIDHGKTALIKALTGIDCDRLQEEKERGITIDIGFASLDLPPDIHLSIIDVPGHERFVRNMLAGVGGIDLVLLVIASDEGVMPQTKEHLAICQLLRIKDGLVALTKQDMVEEEWVQLVKEEVGDFLRGTFLEGRPIIPVSSKTNQNVDLLIEQIKLQAEKVVGKSSEGRLRIPVDRVFSMRGFGTVVTGTLFSGRVRVEDKIEIFPKGLLGRIRGIQVHNNAVDEAVAGQRVALNISGLERTQIERGYIVSHPEALKVTSAIDTSLELLADAPRPLKNRDRVRFHLGTAELMAKVIFGEKEQLRPGETAFARLLFESPTVAFSKDRFVIRSLSPVLTIGGGSILDVAPKRIRKLRDLPVNYLQALKDGADLPFLEQQLLHAQSSGLMIAELCKRTYLARETLDLLLAKLESAEKIIRLDGEEGCVVHRMPYEDLERQIEDFLHSYHKSFPLKTGILLEELRSKFRSLPEKIFMHALKSLETKEIICLQQKSVRLFGFQVELHNEEVQLKEKLEEAFLKGWGQPDDPEETIGRLSLERKLGHNLIQVLVDEGNLIRLKGNLIFHRKFIDEAIGTLRNYLKDNREITASQFRDLLGITRKYAIPLLEYFDGRRITLRAGDKRVLRKS